MEGTRRQFVQTALTGAALLATGGDALAFVNPCEAASAGESGEKSGAFETVTASDGTQMKLFVARPKAQKAPGVIVLQEIFGVNAYIRDVTQRIAALGYVAAAPDLFHRTAPGFESGYTDMQPGFEQMQKMTEAGLEADLKAAYGFLANDSQVDGGRIGSVGYCMGGKASFIANAILPLRAAVSYYGGGISELLPRVHDMHAPMLLMWGGKDTHIGRDKQNAVAAAFKSAGKPYLDVEFSEADHGFFCDARGSYHPQSARESWALFQAFFKEHLQA